MLFRSPGCPPGRGRLHTCYSPVRRSPAGRASSPPAAPRLACVRPAASVHPEPGSNSSLFIFFLFFRFVRSGAPVRPAGNRRVSGHDAPLRLAALCPVAILSMSSHKRNAVNPGAPRSLVCGCKITSRWHLFPNVFGPFTQTSPFLCAHPLNINRLNKC